MDSCYFLMVLAIVVVIQFVEVQNVHVSPSQICVKELEYLHNGRCCALCPPGYYKVKDCTKNFQTVCEECKDHTYREQPHSESWCKLCTPCHSQVHQEEKTPCRKDQNRVCQCMQGYYIPPRWISEVCFRHMKCPPGKGVDKMGTRVRNTVCGACAQGMFSDKMSSRQRCRIWTNCAQLGKKEVKKGTEKHDAICGAKLTATTQTLPLLRSTVESKSTAPAKPQPSYSMLPNSTISMTTTSTSRSSRQQTSESASMPNFTVAPTTPTPSNQQSTSDFMFILKSSTASGSQPAVSEMSSSPLKYISTVQYDFKTLSTKAKTTQAPSSDQGISDFHSSSTHSLGTTTTPAIVASANGGTRAESDQKSTTSPSPAVTIMQPKTSVSYFIELIAKAKPATTPATYTLTETAEQKEETKYEPDVRNNGVHGYSLQMTVIIILSCLLVITVIILAAIVIKFWCYKKQKNISRAVYYNNTSGDVTIGEGSQDDSQNHLMGADGGSGSQDNNSDAVHSVEVHEANQMNTEDEHSPLMSALGGHPEEAAASPSEDPDISEKELAKLAKTIGPGWEAASIQFLDITRAQLETCKADNLLNRNMQIFDTLNLWKTNNKGKATLQTLCQLLTQAEVDYTVEE